MAKNKLLITKDISLSIILTTSAEADVEADKQLLKQ